MRMKIVADSSANLLRYGKVDFKSVPLKIIAGDKEYVDDEKLDVTKMVNDMKSYKGKSGTACPGVGDWIEAFGDAEAVFCVTISSNLSGSYNSALTAKQQYEEEHPDRKVYIIDSYSAGPEMKFIVEKLRELILADKSAEDIYNEVTEYQKYIDIAFSLESLTNLANNGRINPAVAKIASILGIRIVGNVVDGYITPQDKCRGEKRAVAGIIKVMEELGYTGGRVYVDHCDNVSTSQKLREAICEKYPNAEVKFAETRGLCSFYAEKGGLMIGFEHLEKARLD